MTIKTQPEDFQVDERLAASWVERLRPRGPHAVYRVTKRGLTTPQVLTALTKALRTRPGQLAAAGLKDRHALTHQHISAMVNRPPPSLRGRDWSAELVGCLDEPLRPAAIEANAFRLTLRKLSERDVRQMDEVLALLRDEQGRLLVTNYFGNQRFVSARAKRAFIAPLLVRGQYEQAMRSLLTAAHRKDPRPLKQLKHTLADRWGRWDELLPDLPAIPERNIIRYLAQHPDDFAGAFSRLPAIDQQMAVESYQSWLWNELVTRGLAELAEEGVAVSDRYNELNFPSAGSWERLRETSLALPSPKAVYTSPWDGWMEGVMRSEKLTLADLRLPGLDKPFFGSSDRPLCMKATAFRAERPQRDRERGERGEGGEGGLSRVLSFTLPRGGYATVLLRALGQ